MQAPEERVGTSGGGVTLRAVVLGLLTIGGTAFYLTYFGTNLAKSYLLVAVLLLFVG